MAIQRIPDFLTAIKLVKDNTIIESLCNKELSYLRSEYNVNDNPNDSGIYNGLATYKRAITNYRKALYEIDKKHIAREWFKLSEQDAINMAYQNGKSSMRNYSDRMQGNISIINNPKDYIKTSIELLHAVSYIDNILGLAALTGRRVNEIGLSCEFDYCDYEDIYNSYHRFEDIINLETLDMLSVYGLSKKQTYLNDKNSNDSGIIPVLSDKEVIINAISDLRKSKKFIDTNDFHNKASKELSKKVKKRYSDFIGNNCTSHDLRKVYARLTYDLTVYPTVNNNDGLLALIEITLQQKIPDNYMKYLSTRG